MPPTPHPRDVWHEDMTGPQMHDWLFSIVAWQDSVGEEERLSIVAPDYRSVTKRRLSLGMDEPSRDGIAAANDLSREYFPNVQREIIELRPPTVNLTRLTYSDDRGNEMVWLVVRRWREGLLVEEVIFDDDQRDEADAEVERMLAEPRRRRA